VNAVIRNLLPPLLLSALPGLAAIFFAVLYFRERDLRREEAIARHPGGQGLPVDEESDPILVASRAFDNASAYAADVLPPLPADWSLSDAVAGFQAMHEQTRERP
jgi:hypothetical protein